MIALWMAYMLATGAIVALTCHLGEHVARLAGRPSRIVWSAGILAMLLIGALAARPGATTTLLATSAPSAAGSVAISEAVSDRVEASSGWRARYVALRSRVATVRGAAEREISAAGSRLSGWDRPLVALWTVATLVLATIAVSAAYEGNRARRGLDERKIAGTRVLVTDRIGPSAIGVRRGAILLPRWALDLDDALVRLVVRHEHEHLAARDPLLLLGALAALVLLPWDIPLWWCWRRLRLAVEMDCDARVLRAYPDVRRYAQVLLLTAQRALAATRAERTLMTVVAPMQPHPSHLARRIVAMTDSRTKRSRRRVALLVCAASILAAATAILPAPRRAAARETATTERALVHITSVGLVKVELPIKILVYTSGGGRVGLGLDSPKALTDTLRLDHLPGMTLDVTDGDVQLRIVGPGRISVGATVTGGTSTELSGEGRHITLLRGGTGIHTE
ncbi:MAG: hypothetical protein HOQ11_02455 [Gemmatimonadaceae bacterium]|nr:hypothetical protein [Gemmatimonadaceae bacterium]NUQ93050.1 hypothetical protein [Gemmatimonadaceae bacterium]NUS96249.1 hypothetical protein [Gemmatimonadaceae bacterium]